MPYCPDCGSEVDGDAAFCYSCGSALDTPAADNSATTTSEPDGRQETDSTTIDSVGEPSTVTSNAETLSPTASGAIALPPPDQLRSRLQGMDDYEFEHFVAELWERMGWDTEVSQASNDAGIDVVAKQQTPYRQKKFIQVKRYSDSTTVGGPDIQQYASLRHQDPDTDSVVVVTTSRFTSSAEERAEELNVKLVDGDDLVQMIEDLDAADLVSEYLSLRPEPTPNAQPTTIGEDSVSDETEPEPIEVTATGEETSLTDWNRWHWVAAGAGVLTYVTVGNGASGAFGVLLLLTGVTLYLDIRHVRRISDWSPRAYLYLPGLAIGLLSLPIYLVNRFRFV